MELDGVSLDDRFVRQLTTFLDRRLGHKLEQALFFSADVVALTHAERVAVLGALDRMPWEFEELRERFLAGDRWAETVRALG